MLQKHVVQIEIATMPATGCQILVAYRRNAITGGGSAAHRYGPLLPNNEVEFMNNRGLEASTDATEYPRPHGLRLKSILHVLSVLVLITVFSGGRAAFALGSEPTDLNVIDTMNALDAGFSVIEGAASPSLPRHTIPDDLPPLVSQKMTSNIKHSDPSILAQHAQEQQVLLHYAHRNLDLAPRFHAKQNKKHAAMTGRSQLLILAIAFLLMSGVTITLWRQLGNLVPTAPRNRVGPPRRLR